MNSKTRELADKPVGQLMWKYYVPAFVGVVANSLYNIVDRIFIGQGVGSAALAGVSVVFPVMIIVMAFGMLIGIGSSVRISLFLGKRDYPMAERVLGNAVVLIVIVSLLVSLLGFGIKGPMLRLFGATSETVMYAQEYLNIILVGVVFQILGFGLNSMIRSEGSARIAMYSMLISAGSNVILDYLFIFHFGMGVKGAAYATVLSMIILTVWVFMHFRGTRSVVKLRFPNMRLDVGVIKGIIAIGMAPFFMQIAGSFVQGIFNIKLISYGGDVAVAAMGIIMSIAMLVVMAMVAINMASQPIIGYNYGAKKFDRVLKTLKTGMIASTLIAVVCWVGLELFPAPIIKAFNDDDPQLLKIGVEGIRIFLIMFPVIGFQVIASNYFQSVGKAKTAALLTLLRQVMVLIPALLILPGFFGLQGIWMAAPVADVVSGGITAGFLINEWKKLKSRV